MIKRFGVRFPAPLSPLGYGLESISKFHITNVVSLCVSVKDPDLNNLRFFGKEQMAMFIGYQNYNQNVVV